jgi:hypothetical protein
MKWFSYTVNEYKASLLLCKCEFLRLFENGEKKLLNDSFTTLQPQPK